MAVSTSAQSEPANLKNSPPCSYTLDSGPDMGLSEAQVSAGALTGLS